MIFEHAYHGHTAVTAAGDGTAVAFAPDLMRPPTYFEGELGLALPFREAISALNAVVISDLRFKPKEREDYMAWLATQELVDWGAVAGRKQAIADRLAVLGEERSALYALRRARRAPFEEARRKYFSWIFENDYVKWIVLDPVVSVHPDEVAFECFSQDESSYGRLAVGYDAFARVGERACGTTNVDYSPRLYQEFQKIRTTRPTRLAVDARGFDVQVQTHAAWREKKIDLPESWVRGFLQVNAAMGRPAARFTLHPMDVHNLLFVLRRHKEKTGPRSLRWRLTPGQPVQAVFDPWGTVVECPRSVYLGEEALEVRTWGRRRLLVLERLIPIARGFTVHLLGSGMPSFYLADLGPMTFTLGLSGWTANDWAATAAFDLMAPRREVDEGTRRRIFEALRADWLGTADDLARKLGLDRGIVTSALDAYAQAGRVMFDLGRGVYRARELSRDPLPVDALRFTSPGEALANELVARGRVTVTEARDAGNGVLALAGEVLDRPDDDDSQTYFPSLMLDGDGGMMAAECGCAWFRRHKLHQGPCAHMLALRLRHRLPDAPST